MKKLEQHQALILFLIFLAIPIIGIFVSLSWAKAKDKTDNTRDYAYEHYCDSIYDVNPDYYLDVLVETEEYQKYIEEHGEWWYEL